MSSASCRFAACSAALFLLTVDAAGAQSADSARRIAPRPGATREMAPERWERHRRSEGGEFGPGRGGMRFHRSRFGPDGLGDGASGREAGMRFGAGLRAPLLRGIALSSDQEKALRGSESRHLATAKPLMIEMLSARTDEQLARLNGDQKALEQASARLGAARAKLDSLGSQRSPTRDLRALLSPEQQKILDKNLSQMGDDRGPGQGGWRDSGGRGAMMPRGFRDRMRSRRPYSELHSMRPDTTDVDADHDDLFGDDR